MLSESESFKKGFKLLLSMYAFGFFKTFISETFNCVQFCIKGLQ